ncbi:MAG TPA: LegC family aminotransferase [Sedimentibacter sp.]|nr:LegC family aminotransferase [Sedimentibacter sp.]HOA19574.1 LegC family aminotransferase [Sedimentibacter sp.]HOG62641.1 LegC family aminotransferase [Sedimentibacter sp.]
MAQRFIPLSVPNLKGRELQYVQDAIETEWVSTAGKYVNKFEEKIISYAITKGAVSCQNGTAGLHTALIVSGVTKDDEVIVPALTFIASVNPVKYIGAEPVFMDCDDSLNMDTDKLEDFCRRECIFADGSLINKQTKKHIKAIIIVHVFGNMADMESIIEIAREYNLIVIEDAAEAIGTYYTQGKYEGRHAGTIGDAGVYSFNGNKIITTGGGGMIVSNDEDLLKRAKHLTTQAKTDELYYTHDDVGYNYRMTNVQAALGLAQLEQLETFIKIKIENYILYKEKIHEIPGLSLLNFNEDTRSNHWLYSLICGDEYPLNRDEIIMYLSSKGVQARPIWGLINEQIPYLKNQAYKIEKAKFYVDHVVNIPCSTNLTKDEILYVVENLSNAALK